MSQEQAAKQAGMAQGTLSEAEVSGKRSGYTPQLAALYKVNPIWLATGKGDKKTAAPVPNNKTGVTSARSNEVTIDDYFGIDILCIPLLNACGSMGLGNEAPDEELVIDVLRLSKNWVDQNVGATVKTKDLAFIHAIGDSMMPTFNDGDILLVDTGAKAVTEDKIFVLAAHNRLFIKRVRQRLNGDFEISSDNPAVKTVDVLNGDHEVQVCGRVVWVWNGKKV
ncbi:MAG: helix-turn-helix transcriptional regulator [Methylobacillus glycogenes]|nr:helix-turn-helix transcriptional regulator [Methylobacillus glycogenes]